MEKTLEENPNYVPSYEIRNVSLDDDVSHTTGDELWKKSNTTKKSCFYHSCNLEVTKLHVPIIPMYLI